MHGSIAQQLAGEGRLRPWIEALPDDQREELPYRWRFWGRPEQIPPAGDWNTWLFMGGRGSGKTRAGSEWVHEKARTQPIGHLIAPTAADVRDVMVEGPSGILATSHPDFRATWSPTKRRLDWPNGHYALCFSAEEPDRLRGPQCCYLWADEAAAWKVPETWDMAMMGLRLGAHPQAFVSTTPKPMRIVRDLVAQAKAVDGVVTTHGSTYRNAANLAPNFLAAIQRRYQGTRLGRQELEGELLEELEGALWSRATIDTARIQTSSLPSLRRVVVAIDPAVTSDSDSDETGMVVAGRSDDGHAYVLGDVSGRLTPDAWARRAIDAYGHHGGDRIIGEANNGGDLIEHTLRTIDRSIPYRKVHASRGKRARAEPIAALYEQGRVHHVGAFPDLEDQMCTWEPNSGQRSPDRLDALVWALTELMVTRGTDWSTVDRFYGSAA